MTDTSNRHGFGSMPKEKLREIARKGGRNVPSKKRSFSKYDGLAKRAGEKGGKSLNGAKRSFSLNRELASRAGKLGAQARIKKMKERKDRENEKVQND